MKPTLHYAGKPGDGYGWGVCNHYLRRELSKRVDLTEVSGPVEMDCPVFMPLQDHDFNPISPVRGSVNYAYTFFEFPLGSMARENARRYETVFCGSTWCLNRMQDAGINNAEVLVQGVDHDLFKPAPPREGDGLRIFSGGKLEYRKGQDIVLAALDILSQRFSDVSLTASWFNLWPATAASLLDSPYISPDLVEVLQRITASPGGYKAANIEFLPQIPNREMAGHMAATDIGIFPNRCEGGTNLVLMEYLATGRPAVVSNGTGHLDVIDANCVTVDGTTTENWWCEVTPAAVADAVERARAMKTTPPTRKWTWERAANQIFERIYG